MEAKLLKIVEWTKTKLRVNLKSTDNIYFYDREIWWANIGSNVGFEQDGKNLNFSRPVLILKKFNKNMAWALPLTSNGKAGDYFCNLYNEEYNYIVILPQLKLISSKRLIRKMAKIFVNDFELVKNRIKEFI